jgi:diguanylate cyclase (GGDEF)-like protein
MIKSESIGQKALTTWTKKYQFKRLPVIALGFLLILWIWATQSYLLFHLVVEFLSIFIALALYFVGTRTHRFSKNNLLLFISVAYLFVAILDTAHALSYKGMNIIPTATTNTATQLWIAARLLAMSTLCIATFVGYREYSSFRLHLIFGAITIALLVSISIGTFPACYIENAGLTLFKKAMEFLIILIGLVAFIRLYNHTIKLDKNDKNLIGWVIWLTIASELCFALYVDVYGALNAFGHLLKVIYSGLLWIYILKEGLDKPYDLMYSKLFEQSIRDPLTGLLNRRGLEHMSQNMFNRAIRFPCTFTLMIIDLDSFKRVNDEYGHPEGDLALNEFGKILRVCFREYDIISRIGGDEFVTVLEGGPEYWPAIEARLLAAIASWVNGNEQRRFLGATWGMALRQKGANTDLVSLIEEADAKLLKGKALKHMDGTTLRANR